MKWVLDLYWISCNEMKMYLLNNVRDYKIQALTAPIIMRKMSHRNPNSTMNDVGVCLGTRRMVSSGHKKAAKNPVSNIWDSHPYNINKTNRFAYTKKITIFNETWKFTYCLSQQVCHSKCVYFLKLIEFEWTRKKTYQTNTCIK